MALPRYKFLDVAEVAIIANAILGEEFRTYGFRHLDVDEVEDFDGEFIFKMTAKVDAKVPASVLINAIAKINGALRAQGDVRFVNLSTQIGEIEEIISDEED